MNNLLEIKSIYFAFKNILRVITKYQLGNKTVTGLEFTELVEMWRFNCEQELRHIPLNTLMKLRVARAHEKIEEIPQASGVGGMYRFIKIVYFICNFYYKIKMNLFIIIVYLLLNNK